MAGGAVARCRFLTKVGRVGAEVVDPPRWRRGGGEQVWCRTCSLKPQVRGWKEQEVQEEHLFYIQIEKKEKLNR